MAIQIPNPGTGNGATGDNEYVLWSKVKDNFSNQTHAASRLVGIGSGNLPAYDSNGIEGTGIGKNTQGAIISIPSGSTLEQFRAYLSSVNTNGFFRVHNVTSSIRGITAYSPLIYWKAGNLNTLISVGVTRKGIFATVWNDTTPDDDTYEIYTDRNTTTDGNGFIKAASPIVKVFADKVELNTDAENQNVTHKRNGVGDYTITTASRLSTDGWYIELPKDMNGNPKVAIGTLEETDGVISLKTYKRKFNMETFTFEPDLDNPLDIPETRWIDLRLNEIPVEIEDDMKTEV